MANLRVNGDPKATNDLYSLSQYADDRYTIWHSCIVNGVRFAAKNVTTSSRHNVVEFVQGVIMRVVISHIMVFYLKF